MADDKKITPVGPHGLKLADSVRNVHHVTAAEGTAPEHLISPDFWVHVARLMASGDKVEVLAHDASWYAELRVMEVGKGGHQGARVAFTLPPVALENKNSIGPLEDYETRWGGPNGGWQVIRSDTKEVVKKDMPDQKAAEKWIVSHRKAMTI